MHQQDAETLAATPLGAFTADHIADYNEQVADCPGPIKAGCT